LAVSAPWAHGPYSRMRRLDSPLLRLDSVNPQGPRPHFTVTLILSKRLPDHTCLKTYNNAMASWQPYLAMIPRVGLHFRLLRLPLQSNTLRVRTLSYSFLFQTSPWRLDSSHYAVEPPSPTTSFPRATPPPRTSSSGLQDLSLT
jgi:hypothetical protein